MRIELDHLTVVRGSNRILDDFTASAQENETIIIAGPNGAGKSTLLRLLATLETPSSGRVLADGIPIRRSAAAWRDRLGYLPPKPQFYEHMTIYAWMNYLAGLKAIPARLRPDRVDWLLTQTRTRRYAGEVLARASIGIRQRVAMASAFLNDPELLLLDEPLEALDPEMRIVILNWLQRQQAGRLLIIVSHVLAGWENIVTRIWFMEQGRLVKDCSISDLLNEASCGAVDNPITLEQAYANFFIFQQARAACKGNT